MEGLPFLPGYSYDDPTKQAYHRSQTLEYRNGFTNPKNPLSVGIGGDQIQYNQVSEAELQSMLKVDPVLTYGQTRKAPPVEFVPAHVAFDKKVLRFYGYWKQTVHESPSETYRVRPITLYYYLEDDSISIVEPEIRNAGFMQGKLIRRQQLPKDDQGGTWHWKDLNTSINVCVYGKTFRITSCDQFTRYFLESEGIVMNGEETIPADPYTTNRTKVEELATYKTPSDYDKLQQFLEMDRKVLRFYCVWDDRESMYGEMQKFVVHYYLADDTMEVREVHEPNDGRDPFPLLVSRHRIPKDIKNIKASHPIISMELTPEEIPEYFSPRDFSIGKTLVIYGRRFLVYDMDDFTKAWYYQNFGVTDFTSVKVDPHLRGKLRKMELPPYNGYGTLEDSLQNCVKLVPEPPKKDFVKLMEMSNVLLRFEAVLDTVKPEDKDRLFIINYRLADDYVSVFERPVRNSGHAGGKFLEPSRIAKPGSMPDNPVYYGPQDFFIGAIIEIFRRRFVLRDCDEYVLKFMMANPDQFSKEQIDSIRTHLEQKTAAESGRPAEAANPSSNATNAGNQTLAAVDHEQLVNEVTMQLKKMGITGRARIDQLFLQFDRDRSGYIDGEKLKVQLKNMYLPFDQALVDRIVARCTPNPSGKISLEEFRSFFESN